jgi:hypothetical protein
LPAVVVEPADLGDAAHAVVVAAGMTFQQLGDALLTVGPGN